MWRMKKEKSIFTGKPIFPFVEICVIGAFLFIPFIGLKQYVGDNDPNWIWIILATLTALTLFVFLFNSTNKTLILTADRMIIKYWLLGQKQYSLRQIKGYDLKEEYDSLGIVKNIRIWIDDKKHIVFTNGNYRDVFVLVGGLKRAGVPYLGTVRITSKYKNLISWFMIIVGALSTLGFLLVQLMKIIR